jgi:regulator of replication initiation timing
MSVPSESPSQTPNEPHRNKQKVNYRLPQGNVTYVGQIAQERGFNNPRGGYDESRAMSTIIEEHQALHLKTSEAISEEMVRKKCDSKRCPLSPPIIENGEACCILKVENKLPQKIHQSLAEAWACADRPLYISRATQEEVDRELQVSRAERDRAEEEATELKKRDAYYGTLRKTLMERDAEKRELGSSLDNVEKENKRLKKQLQPMQEIIEQNEASKSEVVNMRNSLVEKIEENNVLQTDNDQLRRQLEELSHDALVQENEKLTHQLEDAKQYVKVQEAQKNQMIEDLKVEIQHLEALSDKRSQVFNEALSRIGKFLRETRQFAPSLQEPDQLRPYIASLLKAIDDLQGYLNTIAN